MRSRIFVVILSVFFTLPVIAEDVRIKVDFPPMMQEHMMGSMRDHLLALQTITQQLSAQEYDAAADTAEQRLGMSSMNSHGASHFGKLMPKEMSAIGLGMHHAASRFAVTAHDAAVDGGLEKAFGALSKVMQHCVACHAAYKIH